MFVDLFTYLFVVVLTTLSVSHHEAKYNKRALILLNNRAVET